MRKAATIFAAALAAGSAFAGDGGEDDRRAWIVATEADGGVTLEVFANLGEGESGRYMLTALKSGGGGTSSTRQGGAVPASTGGPVGPLTTSRLSLGEGATLSAELVVTDSEGRTYTDKVDVTAE